VAGRGHQRRADLVLDRPAGRQPGSRRPDGRRPETPLLRAPRVARLQGDRGRVPGRVGDGLRLRARPDRGGADPLGRHDRVPDAGAPRADRAHVRGDRGRRAGDRPPLQLDVGDAAARRVPARPRGDHGAGRARHRAVQAARRGDDDGDSVRVLARELPSHRARVRARDLRGGRGRVGTDGGRQDDREPADDGRAVSPGSAATSRGAMRPSSRCIRTTTAGRRSRPRSSG